MEYEMIVACDLNGGIGKDGSIPWCLQEDLLHFKRITTQTRVPGGKNAVIMGRRTWESLKGRPLPGRVNIVLSTKAPAPAPARAAGVIWAKSYEEAMQVCEDLHVEKSFIIGGSSLYAMGLSDARIRHVHLTLIEERAAGCDTFFPLDRLHTLGFVEDSEYTQHCKNDAYRWCHMLLLRLPGELSVSVSVSVPAPS